MNIPRLVVLFVCLAVCVMLGSRTSNAANGMNMIGFGAESVAMGGADLAVTDNPSSMNINPAGLAWCVLPEFDFGLSLMYPDVRHSDQLGNDSGDTLDRSPMPFLAYVHPVGRITTGIGLFIQGGMGAEYQNLVTPVSAMASSGRVPQSFFTGDSVPDTDETRSNVMFVKLTPTVAWRVNPQWTLGASLNVGYGRAEMKLFPETSVMADLDMSGTEGDSPRDFFFGMDLDDASGFGLGVRLGFQYRRGSLMLGGAYFSETSLNLDDGTMTLNLSAVGLGKVNYDAELSDFAWPRRLGLGAAYRITPSFLIAGDVDWINWSSAIETIKIKMSNPDNSLAPPSREIPFRMDWEDQWVWALGVELTPAPNWALRFGFNHGDTPIPNYTLRPLFPAIAEDHLTGGFGVTKGPWTLDLGLEYVFESEKTNYSSDPMLNPFGPGSTETLSQFMVHFMMRRSF